jgi:hypothetical protein
MAMWPSRVNCLSRHTADEISTGRRSNVRGFVHKVTSVHETGGNTLLSVTPGDFAQPCQRCSERGLDCLYSTTRKKPGPPRGFQRSGQQPGATDPGTHSTTTDDTRLSITDTSPIGHHGSIATGTHTPTPATSQTSVFAELTSSSRTEQSGTMIRRPFALLATEETQLLERFVETIHHAIPLFVNPSRIQTQCRGDLVDFILLITAKLTGFAFSSPFDLDGQIEKVLGPGTLEEEMYGNFPPLDVFRKACLLAFYEFHQFPGQQAWLRIGTITRIALWIGLDRLESIHLAYPEWRHLSNEALEDWRYVWWCIYRLDSYANLTAGTPYLIDENRVHTALPCRTSINSTELVMEKLFLPSQPAALWELLTKIPSDPNETRLYNLDIVTSTALRDNPARGRFRIWHSTSSNVGIEGRLSTLRLSLPRDFLNPRRNAFAGEDGLSHHKRLVSVLHLHMTRFLASIQMLTQPPRETGEELDREQRLLRWQQIFEVCQDIAGVSEQWDSSFSLSVDPALTMIVFTALIFLDLQRKSAAAPADSEFAASLQHSETILLLHLEQFAQHWKLPGLLICKSRATRKFG